MPTIYVLSRNIKISEFLSVNFQFLEVKFSVYLNMRVFIMLKKALDSTKTYTQTSKNREVSYLQL